MAKALAKRIDANITRRKRVWDEAQHPRDDRGRFARKGEGGRKWLSRIAATFAARGERIPEHVLSLASASEADRHRVGRVAPADTTKAPVARPSKAAARLSGELAPKRAGGDVAAFLRGDINELPGAPGAPASKPARMADEDVRAFLRGDVDELTPATRPGVAARLAGDLTPKREAIDTPRVTRQTGGMPAAAPATPAKRTTTVTLPDGTAAKRTSQTAVYTHAVVVSTDNRKLASAARDRADRYDLAVAAVEDWKARGSDPKELVRVRTSKRGHVTYSSHLPGFEDVTPHMGEPGRFGSYGPRFARETWTDGAAGMRRLAAKLDDGPAESHNVVRWASRADLAMAGKREFELFETQKYGRVVSVYRVAPVEVQEPKSGGVAPIAARTEPAPAAPKATAPGPVSIYPIPDLVPPTAQERADAEAHQRFIDERVAPLSAEIDALIIEEQRKRSAVNLAETEVANLEAFKITGPELAQKRVKRDTANAELAKASGALETKRAELHAAVKGEVITPEQPAEEPLRGARSELLNSADVARGEGIVWYSERERKVLEEFVRDGHMEPVPGSTGRFARYRITDAGRERLRRADPARYDRRQVRRAKADAEAERRRVKAEAQAKANRLRIDREVEIGRAEGLDPKSVEDNGLDRARELKAKADADAEAARVEELGYGIPEYVKGKYSVDSDYLARSAAGYGGGERVKGTLAFRMKKEGIRFTEDEIASLRPAFTAHLDAMRKLDQANEDWHNANKRRSYLKVLVDRGERDYASMLADADADVRDAVTAQDAALETAKDTHRVLSDGVIARFAAHGKKKTVAAVGVPKPVKAESVPTLLDAPDRSIKQDLQPAIAADPDSEALRRAMLRESRYKHEVVKALSKKDRANSDAAGIRHKLQYTRDPQEKDKIYAEMHAKGAEGAAAERHLLAVKKLRAEAGENVRRETAAYHARRDARAKAGREASETARVEESRRVRGVVPMLDQAESAKLQEVVAGFPTDRAPEDYFLRKHWTQGGASKPWEATRQSTARSLGKRWADKIAVGEDAGNEAMELVGFLRKVHPDRPELREQVLKVSDEVGERKSANAFVNLFRAKGGVTADVTHDEVRKLGWTSQPGLSDSPEAVEIRLKELRKSGRVLPTERLLEDGGYVDNPAYAAVLSGGAAPDVPSLDTPEPEAPKKITRARKGDMIAVVTESSYVGRGYENVKTQHVSLYIVESVSKDGRVTKFFDPQNGTVQTRRWVDPKESYVVSQDSIDVEQARMFAPTHGYASVQELKETILPYLKQKSPSVATKAATPPKPPAAPTPAAGSPKIRPEAIRKVADLGTSFSGNPYSKLGPIEDLSSAEFLRLTGEQKDNVRFLLSKLAKRDDEAGVKARELQQRFGVWKPDAAKPSSVDKDQKLAAARKSAHALAVQNVTNDEDRKTILRGAGQKARDRFGSKFVDYGIGSAADPLLNDVERYAREIRAAEINRADVDRAVAALRKRADEAIDPADEAAAIEEIRKLEKLDVGNPEAARQGMMDAEHDLDRITQLNTLSPLERENEKAKRAKEAAKLAGDAARKEIADMFGGSLYDRYNKDVLSYEERRQVDEYIRQREIEARRRSEASDLRASVTELEEASATLRTEGARAAIADRAKYDRNSADYLADGQTIAHHAAENALTPLRTKAASVLAARTREAEMDRAREAREAATPEGEMKRLKSRITEEIGPRMTDEEVSVAKAEIARLIRAEKLPAASSKRKLTEEQERTAGAARLAISNAIAAPLVAKFNRRRIAAIEKALATVQHEETREKLNLTLKNYRAGFSEMGNTEPVSEQDVAALLKQRDKRVAEWRIARALAPGERGKIDPDVKSDATMIEGLRGKMSAMDEASERFAIAAKKAHPVAARRDLVNGLPGREVKNFEALTSKDPGKSQLREWEISSTWAELGGYHIDLIEGKIGSVRGEYARSRDGQLVLDAMIERLEKELAEARAEREKNLKNARRMMDLLMAGLEEMSRA